MLLTTSAGHEIIIGLPTATDPIPLHGTTRVIFSSGPHLKQMVYCGRCSTWVHETSNSGWSFKQYVGSGPCQKAEKAKAPSSKKKRAPPGNAEISSFFNPLKRPKVTPNEITTSEFESSSETGEAEQVGEEDTDSATALSGTADEADDANGQPISPTDISSLSSRHSHSSDELVPSHQKRKLA